MEVFNKLYSSVSNTVSQLSGVLPGNPVTREFEATRLSCSAGPGLLWNVYKGYKKSTKQAASIFVFEKKLLEKWSKADREIILETLRRGIVQLTKLRHPQILTVQHGLEESRDSLAFATEPVFASLANLLNTVDTKAQTGALTCFPNYKLYDIEIKCGLVQIAAGLSFLHNDVKLLHHNICPESIVINEECAWKIFGLDFCIANQNGPGQDPFWPFTEYCQAMNVLTQPVLDYLAPEYILTATHSTASDIYSLGMLIYTMHSPGYKTLGTINNDYSKFKRFANDLRNLTPSRLNCIPESLREYVKLMLNTTPELRPDLHQFAKIPYLAEVGVNALNFLDNLFHVDNLQKSQFFKSLPEIIKLLPHRVCVNRVIPCLSKEFVNPLMIPFVLPNVLLIAENSTKEEYVNYILPVLKPAMLIHDPIQILLIFMQHMELLLKLTPGEEVKTDILPMLYRALESDAQQIQELCLTVLPTFASLIDYPAMKNALLPRIKKLCISTNFISVRVNCLLCLGKLLEHLDKWLVLDEVIPFLPQIPSREPAVLMGIVGIYKLALTHKKLGITKELLASKVLPFLIPLCVENGLTLNQFHALISLVKQMVSVVETEHRSRLEQLNSIQNESKKMEKTFTSNTLVSPSEPQPDIDQMFSGIKLDSFSSTSSKNDLLPMGEKGLTLEDKQRIAQQQDAVKKLTQQPPPPMTTVNQRQPPRPVDLTSSLLQNNLNQLSTRSSIPNMGLSPMGQNSSPMGQISSPLGQISSPLGQISSPMGKISSPMGHISSPMGQISSPMGQISSPMGQNAGSNASYQNANLNTWGNDSNGSFNNKWNNNQNPSARQDWSAFESLLPTQSNGNNKNAKKSNDSDMMDLLS